LALTLTRECSLVDRRTFATLLAAVIAAPAASFGKAMAIKSGNKQAFARQYDVGANEKQR
jgi:hypothetical protein